MKIKYKVSDGSIIAATTDETINIEATDGYEITIVSFEEPQENIFKYKYEDDNLELIPTFYLEVTTDATDTNGDGYPDIVANSTATCSVTITKKNSQGDVVEDEDTIWIFPTSGKLNTTYTTLVNGVKTLTLTSTPETVLNHIRVSAKNKYITDGEIDIQFIAP